MWDSFLYSVFIRGYYKFRDNVRLNPIFRGSFTSKLHVSDRRKHASQIFSLNCNLTFHSLNTWMKYFLLRAKTGGWMRIGTNWHVVTVWPYFIKHCPPTWPCAGLIISSHCSVAVILLHCLPGDLPKNHEILREAYSLCHRLPVLNTDRFKDEFYNVSTCISEMYNWVVTCKNRL